MNGRPSSLTLVIYNPPWHIRRMSRRRSSTIALHADDGPSGETSLAWLGRWVQKNTRWLTYQLRDRNRSPADIEDLIQTAILRVAESLQRGVTRDPAAVLVRTVSRLSMNDRRDRGRHPYEPHSVEEFETLVDTRPQPEEEVAEEQLWEFMSGVLEKMHPREREVYLLSRQYGLTYSEIAQRLGIGERTVEDDIAAVLKMMLAAAQRCNRRMA